MSKRLCRTAALVGGIATVVLLTAAGPPQDERYPPDIITAKPVLKDNRIYVVQDGDTLWDICDWFFVDPWYWPTLWAYNPQITNPHWIYPGDYVYIRPRGEARRTRILTWSRSRYLTAARDVELLARHKGFIPAKRYRESGVIRNSREEKRMMGEYDEVYVKFQTVKKIRPDEQFTIFRVEDEVHHPHTGDLLGYKINHLGRLNVLSVTKPMVGAVILKSYQEIYRGDLVTRDFEHIRWLSPKKNEVAVKGVIADFFAERSMVGQQHYVFIDKGRKHGVERGNRFVILWRGDGMVPEDHDIDTENLKNYPWETIGAVMVVEPYEHTSLGVITRSIREIHRGMPIEMIRGIDRGPTLHARRRREGAEGVADRVCAD